MDISLSLLEAGNDIHARALARLATEEVAWLGTIGRDGYPHAVPIWFVVHDDRLLVLSEPATAKVRNLRENPHAFLHLEAGENGDHLTVLQGTATLSDRPTVQWLDEIGERYAEKYAEGLVRQELTLESMATRYSTVIEFEAVKLIAW